MPRVKSEAEEWQEGKQINLAGGPLTRKKARTATGPIRAPDEAMSRLPKQVLQLVRGAGIVCDSELAWSWCSAEFKAEVDNLGLEDAETDEAMKNWEEA